jgi:hypothetical protein
VTCASAHALVHGGRGEGGSDREGPCAEREKGTRGATARHWRTRPTRQRERESEWTKETSADRLVPLGSERARESGRSGSCQQVGLACQAERARGRGRTRAGLNGLPWAKLAFPIFPEFLMPFLFIFSRVFNSNSN